MNLSYYDYKDEEIMAVDIETKDPELKLKGSSVLRSLHGQADGYITGVSLSNGTLSEYYPLRHDDLGHEDFTNNLHYLKDQLSSNNRKIFANGLYDLNWLIHYEGIEVKGKFDDVQIAEPLIDEYRKSYSLNNLAETYLDEAKLSNELREYCIDQGWKLSTKSTGIEHLWRMPSEKVANYASEDAKLTYLIFQEQTKKLEAQNLKYIYELEMELFPLLLQMKRTGVLLNLERLSKTGLELADLSYELQNELNNMAGFEVNPNSGRDLEELFKTIGLPVRYGEPTDLMIMKGVFRGNPKFDKNTLGKVDHPIAKKILELRHIKTLISMFLVPYPELTVKDRLHCDFNQLRSDNYGTVSGRFSSSNPNLQQVSGKVEEEYIHTDSEILSGLVIRKLFVPEAGCDWLKGDWSQIEYRLIAHYALGDGSELIRKRYSEDPNVDYHTELGIMAGIDNRKVVKTLNFGAAYGMGVAKMASTYGWNEAEARSVYNSYHKKVPFVKETGKRVGIKAKRVGFIKTLLGRRARLPSSSKAYVMFNRLIQGSAADIMKKAMRDAYKAGIFNTLHPHLTVHDELCCSKPRTKEGDEAGKELKHLMENCVKLKVPVIAKFEIGPNWGELEEWNV